MNSVPLERFHESFVRKPLPDDQKKILRWLSYSDNIECLPTLSSWCELVRKITFHKTKANKDFELPSHDSLIYHCNRASYVMKLIFSISHAQSPELNNFNSYGWDETNNDISIVWGSECVAQASIQTLSCSCRKGCKTNRCKCFSSSVPCNIQCKCCGCLNNVINSIDMSNNCDTHDSLEPQEAVQPPIYLDEEANNSHDSDSDSEDVEIQEYVENCCFEMDILKM